MATVAQRHPLRSRHRSRQPPVAERHHGQLEDWPVFAAEPRMMGDHIYAIWGAHFPALFLGCGTVKMDPVPVPAPGGGLDLSAEQPFGLRPFLHELAGSARPLADPIWLWCTDRYSAIVAVTSRTPTASASSRAASTTRSCPDNVVSRMPVRRVIVMRHGRALCNIGGPDNDYSDSGSNIRVYAWKTDQGVHSGARASRSTTSPAPHHPRGLVGDTLLALVVPALKGAAPWPSVAQPIVWPGGREVDRDRPTDRHTSNGRGRSHGGRHPSPSQLGGGLAAIAILWDQPDRRFRGITPAYAAA